MTTAGEDPKTCTAAGCPKTRHGAKPYCQMHLTRLKHYGTLTGAPPPKPPEQRFWLYVERRAADECWPWLGARHEFGYGLLSVGRRSTYAHRYSYTLATGLSVPAGSVMRHRCDNPPCVNPAHLLLGSPRDNVQDCISRGRKNPAVGLRSPHCRLTDEQIADILSRCDIGESDRDIAKHFGVTWEYVGQLRRGTARSRRIRGAVA